MDWERRNKTWSVVIYVAYMSYSLNVISGLGLAVTDFSALILPEYQYSGGKVGQKSPEGSLT